MLPLPYKGGIINGNSCNLLVRNRQYKNDGRIAFGCSAMGAEVLEETEFEPFFTMVEDNLKGKKVVLFGSYGWGGSYMQDWEARVQADGAELLHPGVLAMGEPDDAARQECKEIGSLLAKA